MTIDYKANIFKYSVISFSYIWIIAFIFFPILIIIGIGLSYESFGREPYLFFISFVGNKVDISPNFQNFFHILSDEIFLNSLANSFKLASIATIICLMIGYPLAYSIFLAPMNIRDTLLTLVIIPFWTAMLIRIYAWIVILKKYGILNNILLSIGLIDQPIEYLYSEGAVILGMVYTYLPFMVLPIYSALKKIDVSIIEASRDLGAKSITIFWKIVVPLTVSGISGGALLVFIMGIGEYVIPDLLGGTNVITIGKLIWSEFFFNRDWVLASATVSVLIVLIMIPLVIFKKTITDNVV